MAEKILEWEGRFDKDGNLTVYTLPPGDGGGRFEVAGINEWYHPAQAQALAGMIKRREYAKARREAVAYIERYTRQADEWTDSNGLRFFLRDTMFNRGARGAAIILQCALNLMGAGLVVDGRVGPKTRAAIAERDVRTLLEHLVTERERYEMRVARRDESSPFWRGLVNRWRKARAHALAYILKEDE